MSVLLSNSRSRNKSNKKNTKDFYLGSAEAEAEDLDGKQNLLHYFEDYLEILPKIAMGRFIITGRKGSGKSAIAKFIQESCKVENDSFCDLIRLNDIALEKVIQFSFKTEETLYDDKEAIIFEWLILVRLIKLLVKNKDSRYTEQFHALEKFLKVNSGYIEIDKFSISEIMKEGKTDVGFEGLSRAFKLSFGKKFNSKASKAPFYMLINPLKETLKDFLNYDVNKNKEFLILFDDLDIDFKADDLNSVRKIISLIRVAKQYNTDLFSKTKAKVIIFIRDDIKRIIENHHADSAKIYSSYEINLNWYTHENFKLSENHTYLKKFINKRIGLNFEEFEIKHNKSDPWLSLVDDTNEIYGKKSSFKYILDYSFYRPRDLILLFKSIGNEEYVFPLNAHIVKVLLRNYAKENISELRNELSIHFSAAEISDIFDILKRYTNYTDYNFLLEKFEKYNFRKESEKILKILAAYSLIGFVDNSAQAPRYYFNHRENFDYDIMISKNYKIISHNLLILYFNPQYI